MTNWQHNIQQSVADLGTGEGADFGFAYVERQTTETYKVQTYSPLEEMDLEFDTAIERVLEVANQGAPKFRCT